MLDNLTGWVTDVIDALGYGGVAFLVALENVFPPIPSEIVLPFAGFVAGRGDAWVVGMIIAATVGSVVGAWILYGVAAAIGPARLRVLVIRHGKWVRITTEDLDRSESWFDHHANRAVLMCRCVPLIRSLISIPAGFRRMNLAKFTLYTLIGSAIWNTLLVGAGYLVGDNWRVIENYVGYLQYAVILAIVLAAAYFVWTRFIRRPKTS